MANQPIQNKCEEMLSHMLEGEGQRGIMTFP